jgi:hypothetical protein
MISIWHLLVLILGITTPISCQTAGFDTITAPASNEVLSAGTTYTIKWEPGSTTGSISIKLLAGPSVANLAMLATIAGKILFPGWSFAYENVPSWNPK